MTNSASRTWDGDQLNVTRADGGRVTATRIQAAELILLDFANSHPVPDCAHGLDDFLDRFDTHEDIAEHLPAARQEIARERATGGSPVTISTLRLQKGMSQMQLAEAIGTSQSMLSLIETRRQKPGEETIRALARELNVSFDALMDALDNG